MNTITLLFVFSVLASTVSAEDIWVKEGFITGNEYLAFADVNKKRYAMGVLDGIFLAPLFGAPKGNIKWLENCVVNMTDSQVAAVLNKYLRDNPQRWHESLNFIAYSAFREVCPR